MRLHENQNMAEFHARVASEIPHVFVKTANTVAFRDWVANEIPYGFAKTVRIHSVHRLGSLWNSASLPEESPRKFR